MMGHHFGVPFHRELQRNIIVSALELLETAETSGAIARFPKTWAQARQEAKRLINSDQNE
ncbi:MAG: hypothetical protein ABIP75_09210 [Pyrinomonadaceae bacterium]